MKLIKKFILTCIFALTTVSLFGCFGVQDIKTLEFVQPPQSIYYLVEVGEAIDAQRQVLDDVRIKITTNTEIKEYTLSQAIEENVVDLEGLDLTTEGTKTLIITLGSDDSIRLTYVYKVVDGLAYELFAGGKGTQTEPFEIETPQQFLNIATKVYGTPTPAPHTIEDLLSADDAEVDRSWKTYYNAVMPYFTNGVYYKITKNLDFTGIDFVPLGMLGGKNFVPFTGVIDGNNKVISNLTLSTKGEVSAMFGGLSGASIKNITFENVQSKDLGTKYAATIFAFPGKLDYAHTNVLYNINIVSGIMIGQRAASFASEASNTLFINCRAGEHFKVVGIDANYGALMGYLTYRTYRYYDASNHTKEDRYLNNEGVEARFAFSTDEETFLNNRLTFAGIDVPVNKFLTAAEKSTFTKPADLYDLYYCYKPSDKSIVIKESTNSIGFLASYIGCNFEGSLLVSDVDREGFSKEAMLCLGNNANQQLSLAVHNTLLNQNVSKGVDSGTRSEIFYSITTVGGKPHQVYSIPATSESHIKLKYNADGSPTVYAEHSDVIDNKVYLKHDIYGLPVLDSVHYYTISSVKLIKVFMDESSNVIGFKSTKETPSTDNIYAEFSE